jgi:hypothetical protein
MLRMTFGLSRYSAPTPATQPTLVSDTCEVSDNPAVLKLLLRLTPP